MSRNEAIAHAISDIFFSFVLIDSVPNSIEFSQHSLWMSGNKAVALSISILFFVSHFVGGRLILFEFTQLILSISGTQGITLTIFLLSSVSYLIDGILTIIIIIEFNPHFPIKKIARHIAVHRCLSQLIAVMSSSRYREIVVKTTVANATRIQRLSAVACCVRVVMSRLGDCRV